MENKPFGLAAEEREVSRGFMTKIRKHLVKTGKWCGNKIRSAINVLTPNNTFGIKCGLNITRQQHGHNDEEQSVSINGHVDVVEVDNNEETEREFSLVDLIASVNRRPRGQTPYRRGPYIQEITCYAVYDIRAALDIGRGSGPVRPLAADPVPPEQENVEVVVDADMEPDQDLVEVKIEK